MLAVLSHGRIRAAFCLLALTACGSPAASHLAATSHGIQTAGSIVNTTYNTYKDHSGQWTSTMGPLTADRNSGIVCDHISPRFRDDNYALWFVAPSDAAELGLRACTPNPYGGEPTCSENYDQCGRAVRVTCTDPTWCASVSQSPSIYQDMVAGKPPVNNYLPEVYLDKLKATTGANAPAPRSVILYITDFCPKLHSENARSGNCRGPQVDISTAAFMLLAKRNAQGYINSALSYHVEMLAEQPAVFGPEPL